MGNLFVRLIGTALDGPSSNTKPNQAMRSLKIKLRLRTLMTTKFSANQIAIKGNATRVAHGDQTECRNGHGYEWDWRSSWRGWEMLMSVLIDKRSCLPSRKGTFGLPAGNR
jgi:hypothetical protein